MTGDPPADAPADALESEANCPRISRASANKAQDMDCGELNSKIKELTNTEKQGRSGTKGLLQRFRDLKGDDAGHPEAIENQQASLRAFLNAYKDKGCGDPPEGSEELANRPVTTPNPDGSTVQNAVKAAAVTGAGVSAGYIAYRAVRMIPSLFPPLWETIPVNAVVP